MCLPLGTVTNKLFALGVHVLSADAIPEQCTIIS